MLRCLGIVWSVSLSCVFSEGRITASHVYFNIQVLNITSLRRNEFILESAPTWGLTNFYRPGICIYDSDVALKMSKNGQNWHYEQDVYNVLCRRFVKHISVLSCRAVSWSLHAKKPVCVCLLDSQLRCDITSPPRSHQTCPVTPKVAVLLRAAVNHLCTLRSNWSKAAFSLSSCSRSRQTASSSCAGPWRRWWLLLWSRPWAR